MCAYPGGRVGLLVVALSTHALVGYTLGAVVAGRSRAGLLGGVIADIDLLFPATLGPPFVHRGITHTALAGVVVVAAVGAAVNREVAVAVGAGILSHLAIDATTSKAIPVAYPLSDRHIGVMLGGHSPAATALLWCCCIGGLLWHRHRKSSRHR
jgi:inner membrane protein